MSILGARHFGAVLGDSRFAWRYLGLRSLISLTRPTQGVVVLLLERTKAKNALSREMVHELRAHVDTMQQDPDTHCVLLGSSGDVFCAGADLKERMEMTVEEAGGFVKRLRSVFDAFSKLRMPSVGVIDGSALGGGAELALACDIRIGGRNAVFAFPETRLGILPGAGGTQRLPRIIGASKAKELIFSGRRVDAEEALSLGLLNRMSAAPMADALELAAEISEGGPIGVQMAKQAIDNGVDVSMAEALDIESRCYEKTLNTEDRLEGLLAFKEKRKPTFKGL